MSGGTVKYFDNNRQEDYDIKQFSVIIVSSYIIKLYQVAKHTAKNDLSTQAWLSYSSVVLGW